MGHSPGLLGLVEGVFDITNLHPCSRILSVWRKTSTEELTLDPLLYHTLRTPKIHSRAGI
jgi:hypothetical protein